MFSPQYIVKMIFQASRIVTNNRKTNAIGEIFVERSENENSEGKVSSQFSEVRSFLKTNTQESFISETFSEELFQIFAM